MANKRRVAMTTVQYEQVRVRDLFRCVRCGVSTTEGAWHHRRSKAVRDEHTHCSCNGVWLDHLCHAAVHRTGFTSRALGLIVARNGLLMPAQAPVLTAQHGWVLLDCQGGYTECEAPEDFTAAAPVVT